MSKYTKEQTVAAINGVIDEIHDGKYQKGESEGVVEGESRGREYDGGDGPRGNNQVYFFGVLSGGTRGSRGSRSCHV
jgi:hypothetical protein